MASYKNFDEKNFIDLFNFVETNKNGFSVKKMLENPAYEGHRDFLNFRRYQATSIAQICDLTNICKKSGLSVNFNYVQSRMVELSTAISNNTIVSLIEYHKKILEEMKGCNLENLPETKKNACLELKFDSAFLLGFFQFVMLSKKAEVFLNEKLNLSNLRDTLRYRKNVKEVSGIDKKEVVVARLEEAFKQSEKEFLELILGDTLDYEDRKTALFIFIQVLEKNWTDNEEPSLKNKLLVLMLLKNCVSLIFENKDFLPENSMYSSDEKNNLVISETIISKAGLGAYRSKKKKVEVLSDLGVKEINRYRRGWGDLVDEGKERVLGEWKGKGDDIDVDEVFQNAPKFLVSSGKDLLNCLNLFFSKSEFKNSKTNLRSFLRHVNNEIAVNMVVPSDRFNSKHFYFLDFFKKSMRSLPLDEKIPIYQEVCSLKPGGFRSEGEIKFFKDLLFIDFLESIVFEKNKIFTDGITSEKSINLFIDDVFFNFLISDNSLLETVSIIYDDPHYKAIREISSFNPIMEFFNIFNNNPYLLNNFLNIFLKKSEEILYKMNDENKVFNVRYMSDIVKMLYPLIVPGDDLFKLSVGDRNEKLIMVKSNFELLDKICKLFSHKFKLDYKDEDRSDWRWFHEDFSGCSLEQRIEKMNIYLSFFKDGKVNSENVKVNSVNKEIVNKKENKMNIIRKPFRF